MTDILADYNGIIALISVFAAIGIFFVQHYVEKRTKKQELHDMIREFTNTILGDIKQISDAIIGDNYEKIKNDEKKIDYTQVYLSTKVYESFIYSGLIAHFESKTQANLDNLYYKIERNNDNLKRRTDAMIIRDSGAATNTDKIQEVIDNFERLITVYEKEIRTLLTEVEVNLKNELNNLS